MWRNWYSLTAEWHTIKTTHWGGGWSYIYLQNGATITCLQFCSSSQFSYPFVWSELAQLRQGLWASCCECARLKNWFSTRSTWFWPLAGSQTSTSYPLKRNMLSFSFIHFIHSAKGKQPSPAFSSILPTNFSYFHFFVSLTFGPSLGLA